MILKAMKTRVATRTCSVIEEYAGHRRKGSAVASDTGSSVIESAVERIRELNERIVTAAKQGGEESVRTLERVLENLAEGLETAGDRSPQWIQELANTQASYIRKMAEAFPALLERVGVRGEGLPIAGYDELSVDEINAQLPNLSHQELSRVDAHEARTKDRKTIRDRIKTLQGR